ncbi:hypothetical protein M9194_09770 [Vibrio sp. S4M6]|uniref:hypothetical protein n=1 Tax=Vibrio sinus TaxID=2946865 RepID=UPI002029E005|nr:hypothetical protein [Vibrio sinus]MCL9781712.1 hypothetical protein [Vibrio sinus]
MEKQRIAIDGYELYEPVNVTCGFVFLFTVIIYVLALFGIEYEPLTTFMGYLALCVVMVIAGPRLRIWVRSDDTHVKQIEAKQIENDDVK